MPHIEMPKLNDFGDAGEVSEIHVAVGDAIEAGDVVISVEMEKSVIEIESTEAGKVASIAIEIGDEVEVGAVLIELE
jgi:pyruvate/2-oxoglutarate dehydrogenase complex dihydrolipoamide acyltransferase (E2) component